MGDKGEIKAYHATRGKEMADGEKLLEEALHCLPLVIQLPPPIGAQLERRHTLD